MEGKDHLMVRLNKKKHYNKQKNISEYIEAFQFCFKAETLLLSRTPSPSTRSAEYILSGFVSVNHRDGETTHSHFRRDKYSDYSSLTNSSDCMTHYDLTDTNIVNHSVWLGLGYQTTWLG